MTNSSSTDALSHPPPMTAFVLQLTQGGLIQIDRGTDETLTPADVTVLPMVLQSIDRQARLDAPHVAPPLSVDAAIWASRVMRWVMRVWMDRTETRTELSDDLQRTQLRLLNAANASEHWSVDLVFRYAADLERRLDALTGHDPLRQTWHGVLAKWPLSALGTPAGSMPLAEQVPEWKIIDGNACLRQLTVDRMIDRKIEFTVEKVVTTDATFDRWQNQWQQSQCRSATGLTLSGKSSTPYHAETNE